MTAGRVLFLEAALGILLWRLAGDADGALDAVRQIGMPAVLGAFLAAAAGLGASGLAWRSLLRGVGASLELVHRVLGTDTVPQRVAGPAILRALGWLTLTWMGYGLSMLLLLAPVTRSDTEAMLAPMALGGFALAWTVGFLAAGVLVVTPAGLGVREVVLLMVLGPMVHGGGAAAAVVLLSRVVHTLADAVWSLVGMGMRAPQQPMSFADHQPVPADRRC